MPRASGGRLLDNVTQFGRLLRGAGIPVGPAQVVEGVRALSLAGVRVKEDVYWALAGTLVTRPEQKRIFDQAFDLFWRLDESERTIAEIVQWRRSSEPAAEDAEDSSEGPLEVRGEAAADEALDPDGDRSADASDSASDRERLAEKHFDQMEPEELAQALGQLAALDVALAPVTTRRRVRDPNGAIVDWRRSFRRLLRGGGTLREFSFASRRETPPAIVVLCDISGSMQLYSRVFVHFMCALGARRRNTFAFLFGTHLTNVSRQIRSRDVAHGVREVSAMTRDFDGGTRIGAALESFNRRWSRRLLARKATVVLATDGLEGEDCALLEAEIARLHRSCGRLVWLNPLLRFQGFQPRAEGVRILLGHVDAMHAMHSPRHLGDVFAALAEAATRPSRLPATLEPVS